MVAFLEQTLMNLTFIRIDGVANTVKTAGHETQARRRGSCSSADSVLLMAQKIIHQLVDDMDGQVLDPGDGETVRFAVDGKSYEIDLSGAHAAQLRDALQPFISAGRRVGAPAKPGRRRASGDLEEVRAWARENGLAVSDRGRVPQRVMEQYSQRGRYSSEG
jgi:hypothetical protein